MNNQQSPPPICLLSSDVDGTLLRSDHSLDPRVSSAIAKTLNLPFPPYIVLATGRTPSSLAPVHKALRLPASYPAICLNGGVTATFNHDTGDCDIRVRTKLSLQQINLVLDTLKSEGVKDWVIFSPNAIYAPECIDPVLRDSLAKDYGEPMPIVVSGDIVSKVLPLEPIKILSFLKPTEGKDELIRFVLGIPMVHCNEYRKKVEPHVEQVRTSGKFLEWMWSGTCKGAAMKALLSELPQKEGIVMAIGDGENDISMFEVADLSVAMGNAPPVVKAKATQVTSSCDEAGVAEALERNVLNKS